MKFRDYLTLILLVIVAVVTVIFPNAIRPEIIEALKSCVYVIIPSVFGMSVIASAISKSGVVGLILGRSMINGDILSAFVLGNVGGYPIGAKILSDGVSDGNLSADDASTALAFCYAPGPAFAVGVVGLGAFGDMRFGLGAMLAVFLSNLTLFIIYLLRCKPVSKPHNRPVRGFSTSLMTESVSSSAGAMLSVCSMILFFTVLRASAAVIIPEITKIKVLQPILEITRISELTPKDGLSISTAAALMSFGGICVIMQVLSIVGGIFSTEKFLAARLISLFLSGFYGFLVGKIFQKSGIIIEAATKIRLSRSPSLIPIFCVLAMVLLTVSRRACEE